MTRFEFVQQMLIKHSSVFFDGRTTDINKIKDIVSSAILAYDVSYEYLQEEGHTEHVEGD